MELTREQAIKEHRKMWRWLAEHPGKQKQDYLEFVEIDWRGMSSSCFLCEYVLGKYEKWECKHCPLDWDERGCTNEDKSLYDEWWYEHDNRRRAELARQIAELPEREEE